MAAVGDVYTGLESVADNGYHTIQPASGGEAVVTYITVAGGGKVIISHYDGTYEAVLMDLSVNGGDSMPFGGQGFPVTNGTYLRVQNVSGGALVIGHSGYYTKATT